MAGPSADFIKPTPQDFDRFVPWVLLEMQIPMVVFVEKIRQVECEHSKTCAKTSATKLRTVKFSNTEISDSNKSKAEFKKSTEYNESLKVFRSIGYNFGDILVVMSAYYDQAQNLTEIAFINCPLPIDWQVFKVISLCFPFHSRLTRFTFKGKHLNCGTIYQIAKILPFSNFTDIILDHSNVPHGNYYILLDQATTLSYLSLSDCDVDDDVCKEIAARIELNRPAAKNLLILNLSINKITDVGAQALGHVLRTNRHLLHLNLCNNSITSVGAADILFSLTEFPMNSQEISEMRNRKKNYVTKKVADKCLKDVTNINIEKSRRKSTKEQKTKFLRTASAVKMPTKNEHDTEHKVATDDYEYDEVFNPSQTVHRNNIWYCNGNLRLCSLNLAYNNLEFSSVVKILDVLFHQNRRQKTNYTGLMRVVIEGNCLPTSCIEYDLINLYLKKAMPIIPVTLKTRGTLIYRLSKDKTRSKHE